MTDRDRRTTDGIDRRTVLKGTAVTGLAASGLTGSASASSWNEITFCAADEDTFRYRFEVSGDVERGGKYESDSYDDVFDDGAEGAVAEERCDSFLFDGDLEELRLSGPGTVIVNGEVIEDTSEDDDDDEDLRNEITVEGQGETVEYKFRVSGRVEKGDLANETDEISDSNTVRGLVGGGGTDTYRYSGAIAFDRADGPVTVTLDIDPD